MSDRDKKIKTIGLISSLMLTACWIVFVSFQLSIKNKEDSRMSRFDVKAALADGHSLNEIVRFLSIEQKFDYAEASRNGLDDATIVSFLTAPQENPIPTLAYVVIFGVSFLAFSFPWAMSRLVLLGVRRVVIITVGLVLIGLSGIYPPWEEYAPKGGEISLAYDFIWSPPQRGSIDVTRLAVQCLAIIALTAASSLAFNQKQKDCA